MGPERRADQAVEDVHLPFEAEHRRQLAGAVPGPVQAGLAVVAGEAVDPVLDLDALEGPAHQRVRPWFDETLQQPAAARSPANPVVAGSAVLRSEP